MVSAAKQVAEQTDSPIASRVAVFVVSHQAEVDEREDADWKSHEKDKWHENSKHTAESQQCQPKPPCVRQ